MKVMSDETWGPLISINRAGSLDDAVWLANDIRYGLESPVQCGHDQTDLRRWRDCKGCGSGSQGYAFSVPDTTANTHTLTLLRMAPEGCT